MADSSVVSRVRTSAGTRQNNGYKKHSKNSKQTTRRAASAFWGIFGEAKVQVTGHRSGHRLQATGHRSQATGQATGHRSGHRSHKKQYDTGQNCSGLTFYYTKIK